VFEGSGAVLPIPDRPHIGLTTYDAKDPDTRFPPIESLLPPSDAPNVLNSKFNGKIELVQIGAGADSHDHLVDPEELIRVAMSRQ
jgi:hypothetical protein